MRRTVVVVNSVLAFVLELGAFVLLGVASWSAPGPDGLRVALVVVVELMAATAWGLYASPRPRHDVAWASWAVRVVVFGLAAVALALAVGAGWGVAFAGLVAVTLVVGERVGSLASVG